MSVPSISRSVIITAGGIGKRMGAEIPKQFLELSGEPILMHTIRKFSNLRDAAEIIVVLPQSQIQTWSDLCLKHNFKIIHTVIEGGKERFHSVKNGLEKATGQLIAVHDAVRPFVAENVIETCFEVAEKKGAAVPVLDLKESLRNIGQNPSIAVPRSDYALVQTPQCFRANLLREAYHNDYQTIFTDDASVVEHAGKLVSLVSGNEENIKITTPMDLKWARFFLANE